MWPFWGERQQAAANIHEADVACLLCFLKLCDESTTPETVTMERNGLCDTCGEIIHTHTYRTLLLGRLSFYFKALLATSVYAGTKCTHTGFPWCSPEGCSLNNWSDWSLVLWEIPHLLLKADAKSTRVFFRGPLTHTHTHTSASPAWRMMPTQHVEEGVTLACTHKNTHGHRWKTDNRPWRENKGGDRRLP